MINVKHCYSVMNLIIDLKLSLYIKERQNFQLLTHITTLQPPKDPPIIVQIAGSPRQNATAKDSEWVRFAQCLSLWDFSLLKLNRKDVGIWKFLGMKGN